MKVKEFVSKQIMFAENPVKFDISMSTSVSDETTALTTENYNELGELDVDYWGMRGSRMCLYCS